MRFRLSRFFSRNAWLAYAGFKAPYFLTLILWVGVLPGCPAYRSGPPPFSYRIVPHMTYSDVSIDRYQPADLMIHGRLTPQPIGAVRARVSPDRVSLFLLNEIIVIAENDESAQRIARSLGGEVLGSFLPPRPPASLGISEAEYLQNIEEMKTKDRTELGGIPYVLRLPDAATADENIPVHHRD